jgi:3-methyladenine DNA glycosylase AlkC
MAAPLKDHVNEGVVDNLAAALSRRHQAFDPASFRSEVAETLADLELKERINLIADALATHLPADYPAALAIVVGAATEPGIDGWAAWPLCSFVERHGLDHPEASLQAMTTLTTRWSCEFAIRPYLDHHLDLTRTHLRRWVTDADEAVRRLASEGTRPLLPWGPKVPALLDDPQIGIEVLQALRHDPSETVRRSVANHLNDIAKADPALVVETLRAWVGEDEPIDDRLVGHALRTLVKRGDPDALALLGFTTDPQVAVGPFTCQPDLVPIGNDVELTAQLTSTADHEQLLVIDFVVHHVLQSGATSPKTFKWTNLRLDPGQVVSISKRRSIRPLSTRRYHPGAHRVDLQVAGHTLASTEFEVIPVPCME